MSERMADRTPERRASPQMPVLCELCHYAIPAMYEEFVHCVHGPRSEVRSKSLNRLCGDFRPAEPIASENLPAARSEARTAGRDDEAQNAAMFHGNVSRKGLYVLVTRKGSLKNETNLPPGYGKASAKNGTSGDQQA